MRCPLCGGPLRQEAVDLFACEVGHRLSGAGVQSVASHRATVALWMAINALETEAELFRAVGRDQDDSDLCVGANRAQKDAEILRAIAAIHDAPVAQADTGDRG